MSLEERLKLRERVRRRGEPTYDIPRKTVFSFPKTVSDVELGLVYLRPRDYQE